MAEPEKNEEPRARPDNREPTADLIEASGHGAASKTGYIAAADPAHAGRSKNAVAERGASIHVFCSRGRSPGAARVVKRMPRNAFGLAAVQVSVKGRWSSRGVSVRAPAVVVSDAVRSQVVTRV